MTITTCLPLAAITGILGALAALPGNLDESNLPQEIRDNVCEFIEQAPDAMVEPAVELPAAAATFEAAEAQEEPILLAQAAPAAATVPAAPAAPSTPAAEDSESSPTAESTVQASVAEGGSGGRVSDEARPIVERLQSFYENTDDFSASFHQTYTYQVGRQVESRGSVAFKKPAMMRWDYEEPRSRTFIVDGTDLWIWTPEDFSVVRQRDFTASDLSTSITFLWGEGRLEDEFHIELQGKDRLSLTPIRPESAFQSVIFRVDLETGRVLESTVIDPQGNRNHMVFTDVRLNAGMPRDRFVFTPPTGADLQEMPSLR